MKRILILCFLFFLSESIQAQTPTADELLKAAYKQAAVENKNVLVIFTASWCVWCKKMDTSLTDSACKKYFDDSYIIVHLAVFENGVKKKLENKGATDLIKKYGGGLDTGIPFWLVFDKTGNLLADSFIQSAEGKKTIVGCPASKAEVEAFVTILKSSSSLSDAALAVITTVFRKNDKPH